MEKKTEDNGRGQVQRTKAEDNGRGQGQKTRTEKERLMDREFVFNVCIIF